MSHSCCNRMPLVSTGFNLLSAAPCDMKRDMKEATVVHLPHLATSMAAAVAKPRVRLVGEHFRKGLKIQLKPNPPVPIPARVSMFHGLLTSRENTWSRLVPTLP